MPPLGEHNKLLKNTVTKITHALIIISFYPILSTAYKAEQNIYIYKSCLKTTQTDKRYYTIYT